MPCVPCVYVCVCVCMRVCMRVCMCVCVCVCVLRNAIRDAHQDALRCRVHQVALPCAPGCVAMFIFTQLGKYAWLVVTYRGGTSMENIVVSGGGTGAGNPVAHEAGIVAAPRAARRAQFAHEAHRKGFKFITGSAVARMGAFVLFTLRSHHTVQRRVGIFDTRTGATHFPFGDACDGMHGTQPAVAFNSACGVVMSPDDMSALVCTCEMRQRPHDGTFESDVFRIDLESLASLVSLASLASLATHHQLLPAGPVAPVPGSVPASAITKYTGFTRAKSICMSASGKFAIVAESYSVCRLDIETGIVTRPFIFSEALPHRDDAVFDNMNCVAISADDSFFLVASYAHLVYRIDLGTDYVTHIYDCTLPGPRQWLHINSIAIARTGLFALATNPAGLHVIDLCTGQSRSYRASTLGALHWAGTHAWDAVEAAAKGAAPERTSADGAMAESATAKRATAEGATADRVAVGGGDALDVGVGTGDLITLHNVAIASCGKAALVAAGTAGVFIVGIRPGTSGGAASASTAASFFRRVPVPDVAWRVALLDDDTMVVFGDSPVPVKCPTTLHEVLADGLEVSTHSHAPSAVPMYVM